MPSTTGCSPHQPPEHSGGYTAPDLIAAARAVGITGDTFARCVRDGEGLLRSVREATR
ncbi:MAG: hypothetical protein ACRDPK_14565 [Carbonactinosporaceae bacterium]